MEWKIFYDNGETYSDEDGLPELAPKRGVQAIAVKDSLIGRRIESSTDQYIWSPQQGGWRGTDQFGLFDYLIEPGYKIVLFGRVIPDDEYRELWNKVSQDPDLPPKSGKTRRERG